ncbi:MAG: ATPase, T2SS/T4P/T4SS family [bacterium]
MLMKLGEMLIDKGLITKKDLDHALEIQKSNDKLLGHILINLKLVTEEQLLSILSEQLKIPFKRLNEVAVDEDLLKKIPIPFMEEYKFVPIGVEQGNLLTIASPNPINAALKDNMRVYFGFNIDPLLTPTKDVLDFITDHKVKEELQVKNKEDFSDSEIMISKIKQDDNVKDNPDSVKEFFSNIYQEGLKRKANFIYLEKRKEDFHLLYKTNERLEEDSLPKEIGQLYPKLTLFIKNNCSLIASKDALKQYLLIEVIGDKKIKLKMCIIPTLIGENIFIEVLIDYPPVQIENLINNQRDMKFIKNILEERKGLIIISGPINSVQEDTLYSILKGLNITRNKIVLLEYTSKYELVGIDQIQMSQLGELSLPQVLKDVISYEPDILATSESFTPELIKLLTNFVVSKRLAICTLQAQDSFDALNIILESGVNLRKLETVPIVFISQILIRQICPRCKEECEKSTQDLIIKQLLIHKDKFSIEAGQLNGEKIFTGRGCTYCNFSGYSEKIPICEVLKIENKLKEACLNKAPLDQLRYLARQEGMQTLNERIVEKLLDGVTTLEEVERII